MIGPRRSSFDTMTALRRPFRILHQPVEGRAGLFYPGDTLFRPWGNCPFSALIPCLPENPFSCGVPTLPAVVARRQKAAILDHVRRNAFRFDIDQVILALFPQ